jgi:hypothetical protein
MKKIIKGKRYDTETARLMGSWGNNRTDFSYVHEELYRKKTGEYFLYGRGGAMSKYAEAVDQNSWSGGSNIRPLTYEEARDWAEHHLDADEYEEIFEPIPEDEANELVQMKFYLTAGTVDALRRMSQETGIQLSKLTEKLMSNILTRAKLK